MSTYLILLYYKNEYAVCGCCDTGKVVVPI